ncbi:two component transcriptional regulator, LuxR family [Nitrosomonas sp. PY1]|uniref:response regulator transcription factor n=1 Tax=Nitrosomonas sp. PY1 TaxID=1803906 RepID=UPI001FC8692E|nr:response regulator [Nitrosomonas sp. PY1]GKS69365.1 two component transcriptional regulator, LuxR family [Nitrosomonas sp. PY1]
MNTYNKPSVFIIDDDIAVRDSLAMMIEQAGMSVQSFASARAFLSVYHASFLGCIIVDIQMPLMDGLQFQEELSRRKIVLPIIFLTGHGDIPMSVRAMKAGALDFLTKPVIREKLLSSINIAFSEAEKRVSALVRNEEMTSRLAKLTKREREVMVLAIQGLSNKETASCLGISHRTVEIYKSHIMYKTGAQNFLDLARIIRESDLD